MLPPVWFARSMGAALVDIVVVERPGISCIHACALVPQQPCPCKSSERRIPCPESDRQERGKPGGPFYLSREYFSYTEKAAKILCC